MTDNSNLISGHGEVQVPGFVVVSDSKVGHNNSSDSGVNLHVGNDQLWDVQREVPVVTRSGRGSGVSLQPNLNPGARGRGTASNNKVAKSVAFGSGSVGGGSGQIITGGGGEGGADEDDDSGHPGRGGQGDPGDEGSGRTHTGVSGSRAHLGGGGGLSPGQDTSSLSSATEIILKLLRTPLPNPCPTSSKLLPAGTEYFRAKIESRQDKYSPVMWADSQIPFNVHIDTVKTAIDVAPAVGVNVSNQYDLFAPPLSELGRSVQTILQRGFDDPTVRAFEDIGAVSGLMSIFNDMGAVCITDHAPMIRLGLMAMSFAPDRWVAYNTSCV